ncbi:STAS domain-containing protein [Spirillospora sp. NPDC029432]|uniref:STAS domain-containing protein n=1 Tax=Spirillospora sp. NPDC029432 TaxID=3154599 RepID=UPI00345718E6
MALDPPVPVTALRSAASPPPEVSMPAHPRPGHTIVALHGALDADSAPALRTHLLGVLHRSARLLILDLGEVSSCDEAGLAVLIGIQRRATGLGITLRLACPRPHITMLLHATGLERSLTVQHFLATSPAAQITLARAC